LVTSFDSNLIVYASAVDHHPKLGGNDNNGRMASNIFHGAKMPETGDFVNKNL
jgi:hypothetical protein